MLDLAGKPPAPPKPDVDIQSIDSPAKVNQFLAALLVGLVAIITLTAFFLGRAQTKKLGQLDEDYTNLASEVQSGIMAETAQKAEQVARALAVLKSNGSDAIMWSGLFKILQTVSTDGVNLVSLSVDSHNQMKIEGDSQSYVLLAHYLATLRTAPVLKKVDLVSASLVETLAGQKVNFVMQIEIDSAKVTASLAGQSAGVK